MPMKTRPEHIAILLVATALAAIGCTTAAPTATPIPTATATPTPTSTPTISMPATAPAEGRPPAPAGLRAQSNGTDELIVRWTMVRGISEVDVEYRIDSGGWQDGGSSLGGGRTDLEDLQCGAYDVRARAYGNGSVWPATWSGWTQPVPATVPCL